MSERNNSDTENMEKKLRNKLAQTKHREKRKNAEKENVRLRERISELEEQIHRLRSSNNNGNCCHCQEYQSNHSGSTSPFNNNPTIPTQPSGTSAAGGILPNIVDICYQQQMDVQSPLTMAPSKKSHQNFALPRHLDNRSPSVSSYCSSNFDEEYVPNIFANSAPDLSLQMATQNSDTPISMIDELSSQFSMAPIQTMNNEFAVLVQHNHSASLINLHHLQNQPSSFDSMIDHFEEEDADLITPCPRTEPSKSTNSRFKY